MDIKDIDHQSDCQPKGGRGWVTIEISVSAITLITRSSIILKHDLTEVYVTTIQFRFTCYSIKTVSLENQPFQSWFGGACDTPHRIIGKSSWKVGGAPGIEIRVVCRHLIQGESETWGLLVKTGLSRHRFLGQLFRGQVCRGWIPGDNRTIWMEFDTLADFHCSTLVGW